MVARLAQIDEERMATFARPALYELVGEDAGTFTLDDFVAVNEDTYDEDEIDMMRALEIGATIQVGPGGAGGEAWLRRVS